MVVDYDGTIINGVGRKPTAWPQGQHERVIKMIESTPKTCMQIASGIRRESSGTKRQSIPLGSQRVLQTTMGSRAKLWFILWVMASH